MHAATVETIRDFFCVTISSIIQIFSMQFVMDKYRNPSMLITESPTNTINNICYNVAILFVMLPQHKFSHIWKKIEIRFFVMEIDL